MIKLWSLEFKAIEDDNAPALTCNMCGKTQPAKGYLLTNIEIAVGAHWSIVMCSEACKKTFLTGKSSERYINSELKRMRKLHRALAIKRM
jgi:hypothetical protein